MRKHGVALCKVCDAVVQRCDCPEHQEKYYNEGLCNVHALMKQNDPRTLKEILQVQEK